MFIFFFFFSSRRRHTRLQGDWSSDVCSSDLAPGGRLARLRLARANVWAMIAAFVGPVIVAAGASIGPGWWFGLLPALGLLGVVALDLRSSPRIMAPAPTDTG